MDMKKEYEKPTIEIEIFETEDVLITNSGTNPEDGFGTIYF